jgi:hypothetical protein
MLSDMTASPIASSAVASPVLSATAAAGMVDLGRRARIMKAIKSIGKLLCRFAVASAWQVDACVEAPFEQYSRTRTFCGHREGDLYEPDPFAAESPFQRDVWPF